MAMKPYKICPWKMTDGAYRVFDRETGKELGSVFKKIYQDGVMTNDHGLRYQIGTITRIEWVFKSVTGGRWHASTLDGAAFELHRGFKVAA